MQFHQYQQNPTITSHLIKKFVKCKICHLTLLSRVLCATIVWLLHAVDHVLLVKKLESYLTWESLENNTIALKKKKKEEKPGVIFLFIFICRLQRITLLVIKLLHCVFVYNIQINTTLNSINIICGVTSSVCLIKNRCLLYMFFLFISKLS